MQNRVVRGIDHLHALFAWRLEATGRSGVLERAIREDAVELQHRFRSERDSP